MPSHIIHIGNSISGALIQTMIHIDLVLPVKVLLREKFMAEITTIFQEPNSYHANLAKCFKRHDKVNELYVVMEEVIAD